MKLAELFRAQTNEAIAKNLQALLQECKNDIVSTMNDLSREGISEHTVHLYRPDVRSNDARYYLPKGISLEDVKQMFLNENEIGGNEGFKYTVYKEHIVIGW